ncbi:YtxH domain-containing protein [Candidatus Dojkabacteria bacterium]|uniref:YtxH domain-containing protein n=1 Tax=Candidatus Dojkabacteria bacterium TaxID=2099670 RepID=A0A955RKR6_9BACT|nr:YtxH domain-containing protein [Candidatus Dojkabacteria bacterium]
MCSRNSYSDTATFVAGTILGAAVGAAVGILFAPRSGEETRTRLKLEGEKAYRDVERSVRTFDKKTLQPAIKNAKKEIDDHVKTVKKEVDKTVNSVKKEVTSRVKKATPKKKSTTKRSTK